MTDGATANLRERKMRQTAAKLTAVSRHLTAQRGLSGFTIEEVCDEVEVSRRTFFNYFASKEDAIIGINPEEEFERFAEEFKGRGSRGWPAVMDDLVELVVAHFETADIDTAGHGEFMQALEREPRLLVRFIGLSRERDRQAVALIAERENVMPDDPRAEAAANVLSAVLRSAGERLVSPANTRDFPSLLNDSLVALRDVLAPTSPRKAAS